MDIAINESLRALQAKWEQADRENREVIYYREFAPKFLPLFCSLPLQGYQGDRPQVKALVSVLGLSWQPVALMIAWARPERVLLLGTSESLGHKVDGIPVLDVIAEVSGFPRKSLEHEELGSAEELDIYKHFKNFVSRHNLKPRDIMLDPTGGKKSMSASAALAGFLTGSWIVYVDYAKYDKAGRVPLAGTEYPRLLHNPLEVFGELEFQRIRKAFSHGHYQEASLLAEELSAKLYEPREAETLGLLAKGYEAWKAFRFGEAFHTLQQCLEKLTKFGFQGKWDWAKEAVHSLQGNLRVLRELVELSERLAKAQVKPASIDEGLPLVLNHMAAAERALEHETPGVSILLVYATLERFVDLVLWTEFGLDDESPDFEKVQIDMELFHNEGAKLMGDKYKPRDPAGPIGLGLGIQLLATLKPELMTDRFLGPFRGLMLDRNRCELEHGLCARPVNRENIKNYLKHVKDLVRTIAKDLDQRLEPYRFYDPEPISA